MAVYEGAEQYIFVSYAHKDASIVVPVIEGIQRLGFRVWYDSGIEAGSEWPEYIAEHLENAAVVLVFMSPAATASRNCRDEINYALEMGKNILVAYIEDTVLTGGMRLRLSSTQALYRSRHPSGDSFLEELCRAQIMQPCKGAVEQVPEKPNIPIWKMIPSEITSLGDLNYEAGKYAEAVACYRRGAEAGDPYGKAGLAKCLFGGQGVPRDAQQAFALALEPAEQGCPPAENLLGACYCTGKGVARDPELAVYWWTRAVEHGFDVAIPNLARMYRLGEGVPQDHRKAVELYRRGAAAGKRAAYVGLSLCYMNGEGVERDPAEAVRLAKQAAELDSADAMNNLGVWYYNGNGVAQDRQEAIRWLTMAADRGNIHAKSMLADIL